MTCPKKKCLLVLNVFASISACKNRSFESKALAAEGGQPFSEKDSPGFTNIQKLNIVYCELLGTTKRYGFSDNTAAQTFKYSASTLNFSAYQNFLRMEDAQRAVQKEAKIDSNNIQFNQSATMHIDFSHDQKWEKFDVSVNIVSDLLDDSKFVFNIFSSYNQNAKKSDSQVISTQKSIPFHEGSWSASIDLGTAEFIGTSPEAAGWIDANNRPTYTIKLTCKSM